MGWPICSNAYDSGASALAYWLGSTLEAEWMPGDYMGLGIQEGSKVQRATGHLQGMACHSRGQVGVEIANVLETYASFRELILQG